MAFSGPQYRFVDPSYGAPQYPGVGHHHGGMLPQYSLPSGNLAQRNAELEAANATLQQRNEELQVCHFWRERGRNGASAFQGRLV